MKKVRNDSLNIELDRPLKWDQLWGLKELAYYLNMRNVQSIRDLKSKGKFNPAIFFQCSGSVRVKPWKVKELIELNELFLD